MFTALSRSSNWDEREALVAMLAHDVQTMFLYNEVGGQDPDRDFQDEAFVKLPHTHLRRITNCFGITIAKLDGRLYSNADVSLARKTLREDFKLIHEQLETVRFTYYVMTCVSIGTDALQ